MDTEAAADVVAEVVRILRVRPPDLTWVRRWATAAEAVRELRAHAARLRRGDPTGVPDLRLLFAPTGALQEIALAGNWPTPYLTLAHRLDTATAD